MSSTYDNQFAVPVLASSDPLNGLICSPGEW